MSMTRVAVLARRISATVLALCLSLAFMPLGCESSGGMGRGDGTERTIHQGGEGPSVPNATVAAFRACATQAEHHKGDMYAFQFDVEVTESGHAGRVRLKDSYPRNPGLESCLAGALESMQIPPFAAQKLLQQAGAVSPESRGLIGNPLLLVVVLMESTVVVDEATFMVAITLATAHDVIEAIRRRTKVKKMCMPLLHECLDTVWQNGKRKECDVCFRNCMAHDGQWPEDICPRYRPN